MTPCIGQSGGKWIFRPMDEVLCCYVCYDTAGCDKLLTVIPERFVKVGWDGDLRGGVGGITKFKPQILEDGDSRVLCQR